MPRPPLDSFAGFRKSRITHRVSIALSFLVCCSLLFSLLVLAKPTLHGQGTTRSGLPPATSGLFPTITQMRNGLPHVWASFGYADLEVLTTFSGEPVDPNEAVGMDPLGVTVMGLPENNTVSVLTQVGLDDGSRYNFAYTGWGQVHQIHHYAAAGNELSYTAYDLPQDDSVSPTDCPRFTQRQDWAANWNDNTPATTTFQFDANGAWGQMTSAPGTSNQVSYREYSSKAYSDWFRGLVASTEIRDQTNAVKKTTTTAWERDFTGVPYAVNPRPKRITISDSDGNRRQTSIEYTSFGLTAEVFEQGPLNTSDWTILRRTHTDYDLSPAYVNLVCGSSNREDTTQEETRFPSARHNLLC